MNRNGTRLGTLLRASVFGALAAVAVLLAQPRDTAAQAGTDWRQCTERAWGSYNECLVEAGSWFDRKICDVAYDLDMGYCAAKLVGDFRRAL